jgi:pyridoxal 5'-phosphate synthase pdxS subunit
MIRSKGEAGSGNIVEAVRHLRQIRRELQALVAATADEHMAHAKALGAPYELVVQVATAGKLPVPLFAAGGIATPADAALCMALGAESVFVGSGVFKSKDPAARARAIVHATTHWQDPAEVLSASRGLGEPMRGLEMEAIPEPERLAARGW